VDEQLVTAPRGWICRRCDLRFDVLVIGPQLPSWIQACPCCGRSTRRVGTIGAARARRPPAESTENALEALSWERRRAAENLN
jgi:hypothetical protein